MTQKINFTTKKLKVNKNIKHEKLLRKDYKYTTI